DIDVDANSGLRRTRYVTVRGTKKQAQVELTKLLASINAGTYVDPGNTTVAEFLERWLRDWGAVNVSPSTLQRYAGIVRKQIIWSAKSKSKNFRPTRSPRCMQRCYAKGATRKPKMRRLQDSHRAPSAMSIGSCTGLSILPPSGALSR